MPVDPTTLAALAVTFVASGMASGGLEEIGKEIYKTIKGVFKKPEESTVLGLLAKYPENPDIQNEVTAKLEENLADNPEIASKLEELLNQIPNIQIKQNTIAQRGSGNISLQDITGSDIKINN